MEPKIISSFLFLITFHIASAQSSIDDVLISVKQHNKSLKSARQYVLAKGAEFHTGLTPENPFVSADYMIGQPVAGGNQFDFLAAQSFDFPSVYSRKGRLADEQEALLFLGFQELEQDVLLEAKLTGLELIYLNRKRSIQLKRKSKAKSRVDTYQHLYDSGEINALDLNKAKIEYLGIQTDLRSTESLIQLYSKKLTELNGGEKIVISDTLYPVSLIVPDYQILEDSIEANDPKLKWLDQQNVVDESQLNVKKALSYPKFETGYHYQSVLGQTFNGIHLGISIPLWENKNNVAAGKLTVELGEYQIDDHKTRHHFEIQSLYQEFEFIKNSLTEYKEAMAGMNSEELLQKSLDLEEINYLTYTLELNYFYFTDDRLEQLEFQYQSVLAKLFKYEL